MMSNYSPQMAVSQSKVHFRYWHGLFGVFLIYVSPVLLTGTLYAFFHTFFKRYFITIPLKTILPGKPRDYSYKSLMSRVLHKPPASQPTHSALVWQCPVLQELTIDDVCLDTLQCYHTLQIHVGNISIDNAIKSHTQHPMDVLPK